MPALSSPSQLLDRIERVLDAHLCATSALISCHQELQAEQGRLQAGVHAPPAHPVVQRLQDHRKAVLMEFLQVAETYQAAQERAAALATAYRMAQRTRYALNKAWRALPVGTAAEVEQEAEERDLQAMVALERAGIEAAGAAKQLQVQRDPLEAWDQRLLQAHQAVQRARQMTQPKPRMTRAVPAALLQPTTPPLQVPAHAPAMRIRRP